MSLSNAEHEKERIRLWAWGALLILAVVSVWGAPGCKWIRKNTTCKGDGAKRCVAKGLRLRRQKEPKSNRKALRLFEAACQGNGQWSAAGCSLAGRMYAEGPKGVVKAPSKAQRMLTQGCKRRQLSGVGKKLETEACYRIGKAYMHAELGAKRNMERARHFLDIGCASGNRFACIYAKTVHTYTGKNALPQLISRCKQGDGTSCGDAGGRYLQGLFGEEKNLAKAMKYIGLSCTANIGQACEVLGGFVAKGEHGEKRDPARARRLFAKGCRLGAGGGCVYLAEILLNDKRTKRAERRKAIGHLRKYCNKRWGPACLRLGKAYRVGSGIRRSSKLARLYIKKACRYKNREACRLLKKL